jgi:hypothetical protein
MNTKFLLPFSISLLFFALFGLGLSLEAFAADAAVTSTYPANRISVVTPDYRATVKGDTTVSFYAPGLATAEATCWKQGPGFGSDSKITPEPIKLDAQGAGSFVFPADSYPHGPIIVRIIGSRGNGKVEDNCYLELFNSGGVAWDAGLKDVPVPPQAAGLKLTFSDDFDKMPTISRTGAGATYCSLKPDSTEFGDAVFADHEGPYDPFFQTETYLRIRMTRRPDLVDPRGWKRTATTGFLSSEREDGTGFHTAGGHDQYFECRMLYGAAPGTWPAFWTLSAKNYLGSPGPCNELDILESYMPHAESYHVTPHEWGYHEGKADKWRVQDVTKIGGRANVCQTFHTYGCLITKDITTYYFDNVKVFEHPTLKYAWSDGNYFMINLAFQDRKDAYHHGNFDRYGGADDLWVDWVRVYEKN